MQFVNAKECAPPRRRRKAEKSLSDHADGDADELTAAVVVDIHRMLRRSRFAGCARTGRRYIAGRTDVVAVVVIIIIGIAIAIIAIALGLLLLLLLSYRRPHCRTLCRLIDW